MYRNVENVNEKYCKCIIHSSPFISHSFVEYPDSETAKGSNGMGQGTVLGVRVRSGQVG